MLLRVGDARPANIDVRLAAILSCVAGAINAAGFHAVGYFSANMTGNVSALSDYIVTGKGQLAALFLAIVTAFIFGSFCSALLIEAGRRRGVPAIYAYSILLEAVLLLLLGCAELFLPGAHSSAMLVVGLSYVMGLQNAATTRISNARVRTTHVSGMATDIGIALAVLSGGGLANEERSAARSRLLLYSTTIASFIGGGIIGVLVYQVINGALLLAAAAILFGIALPEVRRATTVVK
jgi:uncharacterized membrane protein YoaK (UPF0700 family)